MVCGKAEEGGGPHSHIHSRELRSKVGSYSVEGAYAK